MKNWNELAVILKHYEDEMKLTYEILDLAKEYHYTKSITAATELADKYYKLMVLQGHIEFRQC